ncbi:MAG: hypothetical protein EZS28_000812 [Streblomastix strix]|uniref:USP domain-containing protein n=1 Tax=Streblomastix strix TaxID=222440 RepID=A0A5J4X958_9EUKA|nr:MAG: hypothetical protein EZS28_000812 [Streblomastix strix]
MSQTPVSMIQSPLTGQYSQQQVRLKKNNLMKIVYGQTATVSVCKECGKENRYISPFLILSLPLPEEEKDKEKELENQLSEKDKKKEKEKEIKKEKKIVKKYQLEDLLKNFGKQTEVEEYNCGECKKKSTSAHSLHIVRWPKVLIISFNRFVQQYVEVPNNDDKDSKTKNLPKQDKVKNNEKDKIQEKDKESINKLLLVQSQAFWSPSKNNSPQNRRSQLKLKEDRSNQRLCEDDANVDIPPLYGYKLAVVVNHFGSLNDGHYTCTARLNDGRWVTHNDAVASYSSLPQASSDAYILVYIASTAND